MSGLADDIKVGFKERENVPAAFDPRKYSWFSFLLEAESTSGSKCGRKDVNEKFQ
jgi:hypothetical protein